MERSGSSTTEIRSTRRFWRRTDEPAGWWPWGLIPLLGVLLLWLLGSFLVAPAMQRSTKVSVSERLSDYPVTEVAVDGQHVAVRLRAADAETIKIVEALAQSSRCDSWFGRLICPIRVKVSADRAPVQAPVAVVEPEPEPEPELEPDPEPEPGSEIDPAIALREQCNARFAGALSSATIRFRTASAEIADSNDELLERLTSIAEECPGRLLVEGHTDSVGSEQSNLSLSQARADAVRAALVGRGLDASRIDSVGYGETRPIADNTTESGKAQNRRIVVRVADE